MTVKERLHQLVDTLPESEALTAARVLEALHATATPGTTERDPSAAGEAAAERDREFYACPRAAGLRVRPASPRARLPELMDLPGVDLSGAILEEREEALRRWD